MKTKMLSFVLITIAIALGVIGCQGQFAPEISATPGTTTIKLSGWGSSSTEQQLLKEVLQEFEEKHHNIKVKYEVISDQYMDVLKTRLIGDAALDVFFLDALEAPFLMSQNVLEPLNAYIDKEFEIEDFEESLLSSFIYQNQIYGLPKDYSTLALFYNKKIFANSGLNTPPDTWEKLRLYAKQITQDIDKDGRVDIYGFGESPELARQGYKIKAFGGKIVNDQGYPTFASPAALKGLKLVVDQYHQDKSSAQKTDVGTSSGSEMFGQGKVGMVIEGNWAIPYLQETFPNLEFATAPVPSIEKKPGTMIFSVAYVINKQSQHKNAAWKLISYLTGKEGMKKWASKGLALSTRDSVAKELGYDKDILRNPLVAGLNYGTPWQIGKYPGIVVDNFNNQFTSTMLGEQSLEQAIRKAELSANRQIEAMKY
ncbi:MAG: ABC transporter substrate-binding protein [Cyanobacteria bacterium P01_A01_bin.45]